MTVLIAGAPHLNFLEVNHHTALGAAGDVPDLVCLQCDLNGRIGVQKGDAKVQAWVCDGLQQAPSPPVHAHMPLPTSVLLPQSCLSLKAFGCSDQGQAAVHSYPQRISRDRVPCKAVSSKVSLRIVAAGS